MSRRQQEYSSEEKTFTDSTSTYRRTFADLPGTFPATMSREKAQARVDYADGLVALMTYWVQNPESLKQRQKGKRLWEKFYEKRTSV